MGREKQKQGGRVQFCLTTAPMPPLQRTSYVYVSAERDLDKMEDFCVITELQSHAIIRDGSISLYSPPPKHTPQKM